MTRAGALAAAIALVGCGDALQSAALDTTADVMWRARGALEQESELWIARAAIPAGLKQAEGFYVANPDSRPIKRLLASGYCGYASLLQDDWEIATADGRFDEADRLARRAAGLYLRCVNYGLLLLDDRWQRALYGDEDQVRALLAGAGQRALPGLFWTAMGLGGAINMKQGDIRVVAHLSKVELILDRILAVDEGHEHGMAHMLRGSLLCARSAALGGEPEAGRRHFERALALSEGRMLMAKVLLARYCAVATQDRALFRETLIDVLQTPPDVWPEQRLANEIARHKAHRYLRHESDYF